MLCTKLDGQDRYVGLDVGTCAAIAVVYTT